MATRVPLAPPPLEKGRSVGAAGASAKVAATGWGSKLATMIPTRLAQGGLGDLPFQGLFRGGGVCGTSNAVTLPQRGGDAVAPPRPHVTLAVSRSKAGGSNGSRRSATSLPQPRRRML